LNGHERLKFDCIGKIGSASSEFKAGPKPRGPRGEVVEVRQVGTETVYGCGVADAHELIVEGFRTGNTYDQGWTKWQGAAPDLVWMDEEPMDFRLYTESRTRLLTTQGRLIVTFTPLTGETELVLHYMNNPSDKIYLKTATWEDAPHLTEEDKKAIIDSYPEYEQEARSKGIPMMGEGRVFTTPEEAFKVPDKQIQKHWALIKGIDFGIGHPAAVADLAIDRDADVIYVTRTWKQPNVDVATHAEAINRVNPKVSVAWPHDGDNRRNTEKGNTTLRQMYQNQFSVKLLSMSARYNNKKGGAQPVEPIILEMQNRLDSGGLKVFASCTGFFEEYRSYHRKDGKIVALRDDILKSVMYAIMMRRYAAPVFTAKRRQGSPYTRPMV
jgi:phage terminase large subunit-like protein